MRMKLVLQGVSVAAVLALLALLIWKVAHPTKGAKIGAPAPLFALSRIGAPGKLALASLRGKVVVVNFWASWCDPCKAEASALESAWRQFRSQGVVFIGVDSEDFTGDAEHFVHHYKVTYPVVHDGPGSVGPRYGVDGYPETYFVDRQGRLVGARVAGQISASTLRAAIERALKA